MNVVYDILIISGVLILLADIVAVGWLLITAGQYS
jgi:hypothetical protein